MKKSYQISELQSSKRLGLFNLQEEYATKVRDKLGITMSQSLMEFTSFYKRVGCNDWDFNYKNPIWQDYINRVEEGNSPGKLAFEINCAIEEERTKQKKYFGCFRYDWIEEKKTVRIHFKNNDKSNSGPLSSSRIDNRLAELKEMFTEVKSKHPSATTVEGGTWLYNYSAYCRLFPSSYINNSEVEEPPFLRSMGIWGQFLNSEKRINEDRVNEFMKKVDLAETREEFLYAFPFKIIKHKGTINDFYNLYQIDYLL
jgi:hypothetical protein